MNKIEEIAQTHLSVADLNGLPNTIYGWYEDFEKAMQEYAEHYAKKCLEVAVKNAVTKVYIKPIGKGKRYKEICDGDSYNPMETIQKFMVDKNSILNIELPSHD